MGGRACRVHGERLCGGIDPKLPETKIIVDAAKADAAGSRIFLEQLAERKGARLSFNTIDRSRSRRAGIGRLFSCLRIAS